MGTNFHPRKFQTLQTQLVMQKDGEERRDAFNSRRPAKEVPAVLCSSGCHVNRCSVYVAKCMTASWAWLVQRFMRNIASCVETAGMKEKYLRTAVTE